MKYARIQVLAETPPGGLTAGIDWGSADHAVCVVDTAGQVMPAPRALARRHHGDLVRVAAPGQRMSLMPRLAAAPARRALRRLAGAPGPRRGPVRTRRHRGIRRVHPHPPLQLLDLSQQRRDHRISLRQRSQQLLAAELPRIGHPAKLRFTTHTNHGSRKRRVYPKPDTHPAA